MSLSPTASHDGYMNCPGLKTLCYMNNRSWRAATGKGCCLWASQKNLIGHCWNQDTGGLHGPLIWSSRSPLIFFCKMPVLYAFWGILRGRHSSSSVQHYWQFNKLKRFVVTRKGNFPWSRFNMKVSQHSFYNIIWDPDTAFWSESIPISSVLQDARI